MVSEENIKFADSLSTRDVVEIIVAKLCKIFTTELTPEEIVVADGRNSDYICIDTGIVFRKSNSTVQRIPSLQERILLRVVNAQSPLRTTPVNRDTCAPYGVLRESTCVKYISVSPDCILHYTEEFEALRKIYALASKYGIIKPWNVVSPLNVNFRSDARSTETIEILMPAILNHEKDYSPDSLEIVNFLRSGRSSIAIEEATANGSKDLQSRIIVGFKSKFLSSIDDIDIVLDTDSWTVNASLRFRVMTVDQYKFSPSILPSRGSVTDIEKYVYSDIIFPSCNQKFSIAMRCLSLSDIIRPLLCKIIPDEFKDLNIAVSDKYAVTNLFGDSMATHNFDHLAFSIASDNIINIYKSMAPTDKLIVAEPI